jgi:hypothetical protein
VSSKEKLSERSRQEWGVWRPVGVVREEERVDAEEKC